MPQFYDTDNLDCWVVVLAEEHYDGMCYTDDQKAWVKTVMDNVTVFKEWAWEMICEHEIKKQNAFSHAVYNSINWRECYIRVRKALQLDEPAE